MPLIVRVLQHDFPIEREYSAGHVLTAGEASAMNQLLVENIRNNVYSWVVKEAGGSKVLTEEQYSDLTARIAEYGSKYEFRLRTRYRQASALDAAVLELSLQYAEQWGHQNGFEPNSQEVRQRCAELQAQEDIREEARNLIRRRQSVADNALIGLI